MSTPGRSPARIAEELKRLQASNLEDGDRLSMLHEISVYHEEMLVQHEALTRAQAALEQTRDRFIELYDASPTGYLTLDEHGVIRQCNLTAALFIGRARESLEDLPLAGFIATEHRRRYLDFLRRCRQADRKELDIELALRGRPGLEVQLICRPLVGLGGRQLYISVVDINERKGLERERARTAQERASLAKRLLGAIDEERQRIARNLHDDVGQQVTAIRMRLEAQARAEGSASMDITAFQQMLEKLDQSLHVIATELRPAVLDLGLVAALRDFTSEWSQSVNIPVDLHAQDIDARDISADTETHLYRIVQEALHNVAKHAGASHVSVRLFNSQDGILLVVKDNGRGCEIADGHVPGTALGMVGMRERANIIGGTLRITTSPGKGMTIAVHVRRKPSAGGG
jgi:PAS domain S-box-containing protein